MRGQFIVTLSSDRQADVPDAWYRLRTALKRLRTYGLRRARVEYQYRKAKDESVQGCEMPTKG